MATLYDQEPASPEKGTPLRVSDVFRHLIASVAGIDIDHANPDAQPDGWLQASEIFKLQPVSATITRLGCRNIYLKPFEYGGSRVSVFHLIYAFFTYGMQPDVMALELIQNILQHEKLRRLMNMFFLLRGEPVNGQPLILQLKCGLTWEAVADILFREQEFGREMRIWASKYLNRLLGAVAKGIPAKPGSETADKSRALLREQCLRRDGHMTVVGRVWNLTWPKHVVPPPRTELSDYACLKTCEIIPYRAHDFADLRQLLVRFSGDYSIGELVDEATNAFMLTPLFHEAFRRYKWSIDAYPKEHSSGKEYRYRKFSSDLPPALNQHADGEEVFFRTKDRGVLGPEPLLLKVYTALAKVANAAGAIDMINLMIKDEDERQARGRRRTGRGGGVTARNDFVQQLQQMSFSD
ncbi:hypothetical protein ABW21_db0206983 [Orbilia brochopaga]|nr:hypothetical protein ABW21_db0206983 [Drechslerella brochopaga]